MNPLVNVKVYTLVNTHSNTQAKHCKLRCPTQLQKWRQRHLARHNANLREKHCEMCRPRH